MSAWLRLLAPLGLVLLSAAAAYAAAGLVGLGPGPPDEPAFTSGPPPVEHAVSRFHMRWYVVSMLFLAFDMEMVFMYPWVRVVTTVGASAVVEMFTFLAVLLAAVVYAWREGALTWA